MTKIIKRKSKRPLLSALIVLAIVFALVITILEVTNTTHFLHTQKAQSGTIPTLDTTAKNQTTSPTSNTSGNDSTTSTSSAATQTSPKESGGGVSNSDVSLIAPYGSFVSNHSPSLSASPATQELSSCSTSIGAYCHIEFTQGDVIKKLEPRKIDSGGSVSWLWDVKTAGLTAGSWQITAIATLNGQTKTTQDQLTLEVQP